MLPATMTAVSITAAGGPEMLKTESRPVRIPAPVRFSSRWPTQASTGTIAASGKRGYGRKAQPTFRPRGRRGDRRGRSRCDALESWRRACALVNGGGYAQYCIALEPLLLRCRGLRSQTGRLPTRGDVHRLVQRISSGTPRQGRMAARARRLERRRHDRHSTGPVGRRERDHDRRVERENATLASSWARSTRSNYKEADFVAEVKKTTADRGRGRHPRHGRPAPTPSAISNRSRPTGASFISHPADLPNSARRSRRSRQARPW